MKWIEAVTSNRPPVHIKRIFTEEVRTDPGRLMIAWTTKGAAAHIHDDCMAAVDDAARLCESLGHVVEEAAPKVDYEPLLQAFPTLSKQPQLA